MPAPVLRMNGYAWFGPENNAFFALGLLQKHVIGAVRDARFFPGVFAATPAAAKIARVPHGRQEAH